MAPVTDQLTCTWDNEAFCNKLRCTAVMLLLTGSEKDVTDWTYRWEPHNVVVSGLGLGRLGLRVTLDGVV